jgi:glycerol-3-phosphate O-acyltransferase
LAHGRRGIRHAELVARCRRLLGWLQRSGAEPSGALAQFDAALRLSLDRWVSSGVIDATGSPDDRVWAVRPERRLRADFVKNQLLHLFSDAALTAAAMRSQKQATVAALVDDVGWLRSLLAAELVTDPDETTEGAVRRALDELAVHGAVRCLGGDDWQVSDRDRAGEIWSLVRALLEALRLPLRAADRWKGDADALAADLCAEGPTWIESGAVTRPEALVAPVVARFAKAWAQAGVLPQGDVAAARARLDPMVG